MDKKTIITPNSFHKNYINDLWTYREVLYILSWRDIKVRYKQTFIGVLWAILRPLITMLIFTFVFGQVGGLAGEVDLPYSLIVLTGILPWQFFSHAVSDGANSVVKNEKLITKTYFPRILIPASTITTALVDFTISLLLLLLLFVHFEVVITSKAFFTLLFLLLSMMLALGTGLILCVLNVKFRDFRYIIPFMLQIGLFISPVGFDTSAVPGEWAEIYNLNPMVGIIEGFRWALLNGVFPSRGTLTSSILFSIISLALGLYFFVGQEKKFADYI